MAETKVGMRFGPAFEGVLQAQGKQAMVGFQEGGFRPYELLLGALGACFYSTFVDIAKKMRLSYDEVEINIAGVKREETPTTLKEAWIDFRVRGASGEKGFERALKLSEQYCSIHATLSHVADIHTRLHFE